MAGKPPDSYNNIDCIINMLFEIIQFVASMNGLALFPFAMMAESRNITYFSLLYYVYASKEDEAE